MANLYIFVALIAAGGTAVYLSTRVAKRYCARVALDLQRQIDTLNATVKTLSRSAVSAAPALPFSDLAGDAITPETMAAIGETVTALLGKKIRIRSVKQLKTSSLAENPWAEQGRVVVQASHSLVQRGFE